MTYSSIDDKYRLVFAKVEAPLSSIGAVFRRRSSNEEGLLKAAATLRMKD